MTQDISEYAHTPLQTEQRHSFQGHPRPHFGMGATLLKAMPNLDSIENSGVQVQCPVIGLIEYTLENKLTLIPWVSESQQISGMIEFGNFGTLPSDLESQLQQPSESLPHSVPVYFNSTIKKTVEMIKNEQ